MVFSFSIHSLIALLCSLVVLFPRSVSLMSSINSSILRFFEALTRVSRRKRLNRTSFRTQRLPIVNRGLFKHAIRYAKFPTNVASLISVSLSSLFRVLLKVRPAFPSWICNFKNRKKTVNWKTCPRLEPFTLTPRRT